MLTKDLDKNQFYTTLNGVDRYLQNHATLYLEGIYDPNDPDKKELHVDAFINNAAKTTTVESLFEKVVDENFIDCNNKRKLKVKKVKFEFNGSTYDFEEKNVQFTVQGDSSLSWKKKNFKLKFSESRKLPGLVKSKNYMFKADVNNATHSHYQVYGDIWRDMMTMRSDYDSLPKLIKDSKCKGATHGTVVKVYYTYNTGTETVTDYLGAFTACEKKGDKMAGFDADKDLYAAMLSTVYQDEAGRSDLGTNAVLYGKSLSNAFQKIWNGSESVYDFGFEFEDGEKNFKAEKVNSMNQIIDIVQNTTDEEFKAQIVNHIDLTSVIDYIWMSMLSCNPDAFKNIMWYTPDYRDKWYAMLYDFDNCYYSVTGVWNYYGEVGSESRIQLCQWASANNLFVRILNNFKTEIIARYNELKTGAWLPQRLGTHWYKNVTENVDVSQTDHGYYLEDGTFVQIPQHSTSVKYNSTSQAPKAPWTTTIENSIFTSKYPTMNGTATSVMLNSLPVFILDAKRMLEKLDSYVAHWDDMYPYALINRIDTNQKTVNVSGTTANVFDYLTLYPRGNYGTRISADLEKKVVYDPNHIISSIADDGTITFSGSGYAEVVVCVNQVKYNAAQTSSRTPAYWCKVQSEPIRFYHGNATEIDLQIRNGEPYQFGKKLIIEGIPNGLCSGMNYTVTPADTAYETDDNKLYIITKTVEETITVNCTCGSLSKSMTFTTIPPKYISSTEAISFGCNNITNLVYDNTEIECEFSIDNIGPISKSNKGNQILFGVSSTTTVPANDANMITKDYHGLFASLQYRQFGDTDDYQISLQCCFGNRLTPSVNATVFSPTTLAISPSHPMSLKKNENIYLKLTRNYVQINDRKYPYVYETKPLAATAKTSAMMQLWGLRIGSSVNRAKQNSIKIAMAYFRVKENGVLTHNITATSRLAVQNATASTSALQDTIGTSAFTASATTATKSYLDFVGPTIANVGVIEYLPNTDTGIPFMGNNFIDLGLLANNNYTYEVEFKNKFTTATANTGIDSRGCVFGGTTQLTQYYSTTRTHSFGAFNNRFKFWSNASHGSGTGTTMLVQEDVKYKLVWTPTTYEIYADGTLAESKALKRAALTTNLGNIFLGSAGASIDKSSVSNSNSAIAGYVGYIYSFKITDGDGNIVINLTPNSKKTGFIDSVSGKEYLAYISKGSNTLTANVSIGDLEQVDKNLYKLNIAETSNNPVVSFGKYNAVIPSNTGTISPTSYGILGYNAITDKSEFRWKVMNDLDHEYIKMDSEGNITVFASCEDREFTIRCYWSLDPDIYDEKVIHLSFED